MAKARPKSSSKGAGGGVFLGLLLGVALAVGGYLAWNYTSLPHLFSRGNTATQSTEKLASNMAKVARDAPFAPSEDVYEAGAHLYVRNCAHCHGTLKHDSTEGQDMHPAAAQFWSAHHGDTLIHHTSHEVYTAIANGDPSKGMPAYAGKLTDTDLWQITLLLRSSRLELPDPVHDILTSASK